MAVHPENVGKTYGPFTREYTWKDLIIYALGVGTGTDELQYLYEKGQKALPMFATTTISDDTSGDQLRDLGLNMAGVVQYEHELIMYRPLDVKQGTFKSTSKNIGLYDQGAGRGALFMTEISTCDENDQPIFKNIISSMARMDGGFGGEPAPRRKVAFPERDPDVVETASIPENQALLYRLSGDYNILHADPNFAAKVGFEKPILHGLCTYGYAGRLLIKNLCSGNPDSFRRMKAQFKSPVFPGETVQLQAWKTGESAGVFQIVNPKTGSTILANGEFEWT